MKKHFLYLVKNKTNTRFKIGYTFTKDPKIRLRQYVSHNPDTEMHGWWEVKNKTYEQLIHLEILKMGFPKVLLKGQQEWFEGNIFSFEIKNIINKFEERNLI